MKDTRTQLALMYFLRDEIWLFGWCTNDRSATERLAKLKALQTSLAAFQENVCERINAGGQRAIEAHNKETDIVAPLLSLLTLS